MAAIMEKTEGMKYLLAVRRFNVPAVSVLLRAPASHFMLEYGAF